MTIEGNIITASEGMVLTNGENYATVVRLGDWDSVENWHEITYAEYENILQAQMENMDAMF